MIETDRHLRGRTLFIVVAIFVSILGLVSGGILIVLDFSWAKAVVGISAILLVSVFYLAEAIENYPSFFKGKKRERKN